jgi:predicted nuclease of predicted toxin-antitoxin system
VKFLIDECLSPSYVASFGRCGYPDAVHPLNIGLRAVRDDQIVARALVDDRIIVSSNARDFRRLFAEISLHPGAILIEPLERPATWKLILAALAFIEVQPRPADYMVNRVVEVSADAGVRPYMLASGME